ncbi:MAG: acetyltransferase-like isoleucine patch superfamily enzyme [bacterium]|jgi:acetyltransferase-like isoleucine patch superfamily enzyme
MRARLGVARACRAASFPNRVDLGYAAVVVDEVRVDDSAVFGVLNVLGGAADGLGFAVDCSADLVLARRACITASSPYSLTCQAGTQVIIGPNTTVGRWSRRASGSR